MTLTFSVAIFFFWGGGGLSSPGQNHDTYMTIFSFSYKMSCDMITNSINHTFSIDKKY